MHTAYISHQECLLHDMGEHHPECPERLYAIEDRLVAAQLMPLLYLYQAPLAERAHLLRVHEAAYIDALYARAPRPGEPPVPIDNDTALASDTLDSALHAAGAAVLGVDLVMRGEAQTAFCAVRPAGHHATRNQAMGFCFFNNVAVAAAHAFAAHGLERIAIVDFDAHHGNGTEDIFRDDTRVLFCSSYQQDIFPNVPPPDRAHIIHTPLRNGAYSEEFQQAVSEYWLPAIDAFRPQMILISAGFDAHFEDDMSGLNLLDTDFAWVTARLMELATKHCDGRVVSSLEGGYVMDALGRSAAAHIKVLMGLHQ